MAEAERFKVDAQKEKGMTGTNVAAVIFFWPAMIGTYSNANEAISAAEGMTGPSTSFADFSCASRLDQPKVENAANAR